MSEVKKFPKFKNEEEAAEFWDTHSPLEFEPNPKCERVVVIRKKVIPEKIITSCAECFFIRLGFTGTLDKLVPHCFYKEASPHILNMDYTIPSWCPLSDVPQWQEKETK